MMTLTSRTHSRSGAFLFLAMTAALAWVFTGTGTAQAAGPAAASPQVEIKKHSTGKEATITYGDGEWFIHIDVDQDRTMIIRTESHNGKETKNQPEIVERPMSNAEVDRIINDWVSGIKSTLKP
jgi:hypothetical protein